MFHRLCPDGTNENGWTRNSRYIKEFQSADAWGAGIPTWQRGFSAWMFVSAVQVREKSLCGG